MFGLWLSWVYGFGVQKWSSHLEAEDGFVLAKRLLGHGKKTGDLSADI